MAMSEKFDDIRTKARIDNFLAGTSQSPDRVKPEPGQARRGWTQAVRPTSGGRQPALIGPTGATHGWAAESDAGYT